MPSRFIDELPDSFVEKTSDTGLYGAVTAGFAEESGGWGTRHPRRSMAKTTAAGGGWRARDRSGDGADIGAGQRVFHQKFGYGRVLSNDGGKLTVDFDKAGRKTVVAGFVEAA